MGRLTAKLVAATVAALMLGSVFAGASSAEGFRPDQLTINVDRGAREISGTLVADSFYWHVCWGDAYAHIKIRRAQPGRDKLVAEDPETDWDNNWKVRLHGSAVRGKRIYAEVPGFNSCESVRSRTVRAP